jgi:uncharacterized protein YfaP (DUF2135 family)
MRRGLPSLGSAVLVTAVAAVLAGCHGGGVDTPLDDSVAQTAHGSLLGDLNGSGTPDVADAIGILRIVVGLDPDDPLADCDQNGSTGVADAILVLRCLVGLAEWPINGPLALFTISAASGRPGDEVVLSGSGFGFGGSVTEVLFGDSEAPIMELAGTTVRVLVPILDTLAGGACDVTVHVGGESAGPLGFTVAALPEPTLGPAEVAYRVEKSCIHTTTFALESLQELEWVDASADPDLAAVQAEMDAIFAKIGQEIGELSPENAALLEALLQEYGVLDILHELGSLEGTGDVGVIISGADPPSAVPAQDDPYIKQKRYWRIDTFCGIVADLHRALTVIKVVAALTGAGLPVAAIIHAIDVGLNVIAEAINTIVPTDLEELQIADFGLPVGGSYSPPVAGTFAPEHDLVTGTVRTTVAALMPTADIAAEAGNEIVAAVLGMLAEVGLDEASDWSTSRLEYLRRSMDEQVPIDMSQYRTTAIDLLFPWLLELASTKWNAQALANALERAGVPIDAITLYDPVTVSPSGRVNLLLADFVFSGVSPGQADVELDGRRWKPTPLLSWWLGFTVPQSLPEESRGHARITVTVPTPAPTVNLTADATSILQGESTTLRWTSTNATSVVASNFGAPSPSTSGSQVVTPIHTTTYTITVQGPGGQATASVTVTVTTGVGGGIQGTVTDAFGTGLAGVRAQTSNGVGTWQVWSNASGWYYIPSVPAGSRVVTFALGGFVTSHQVTVASGGMVELNVQLSGSSATVTQPPVVTLNPPVVNQDAGTAQLSGQITNLDANVAVLIHNGNESLISVSGDGSFTHTVVLQVGSNRLAVRATNAVATTISNAYTVDYDPAAGDFVFRVTLTWDTDYSDMDLHIWSPSAQHSRFDHKSIDAGSLDVDDTEGYGPENFTCTALQAGRFRIAVNNYDLDGQPPTRCIISVYTGSRASNRISARYGPYLLSTQNGNTGYPVTGNTDSWWRVCDIDVSSAGTVSFQPAEAAALPLGVLSASATGRKSR